MIFEPGEACDSAAFKAGDQGAGAGFPKVHQSPQGILAGSHASHTLAIRGLNMWGLSEGTASLGC